VEETSAGGLVVDRGTGEARAAVIARLNRAGRIEWCLPKGHLEQGETPEQAAVREIEEETGIRGRVVRALGTIEYRFSADGRRIHKLVHHYLLEALGGTLTIEGDPDQEAIDVAWVPLQQLGERLTFPNERRIAREATALLEDTARLRRRRRPAGLPPAPRPGARSPSTSCASRPPPSDRARP
jgi:8-oxo-dGTP pyrophosphatase MutT (NUDIX family)